MLHTDICIAGAGVIGLSLALELQARHLRVAVIEAGQPLREASWAAAGMLAARDPHNPAELSALSALSVSLYPQFLDYLQSLGAAPVPFQTSRTLQSMAPPGASLAIPAADPLLLDSAPTPCSPPFGFDLLDEHSIDPRQLAASLLAAVASSPIRLLTESPLISTQSLSGTIQITTPNSTIEAAHFIDCTGAWASHPDFRVVPIKGQMLALALPSGFPLKVVVRTADIYVVPRATGPMAGRAIIGATVEDAGFDKTVHASQIEDLRRQAVDLLPELAHGRLTDSWAGLRPATPDGLPILGAHPDKPHHWIATGHYRNGILLAPATARVMTQLLLDEPPAGPLDGFSPSRLVLRKTATR